jgi:hypothetical protein
VTEKNLLDRLYIAAPCPAKWDEMQGDDRVRMCAACSKNVYNISDMSKRDAEEFLQSKSTNVCMQFYRRSDGTILTDDCPLALRKLRNALRTGLRAAAAIVGLAISMTLAMAKPGVQTSTKSNKPASHSLDTHIAAIPLDRQNYFKHFPVAGQPYITFGDKYGLPTYLQLISDPHSLQEDEIYLDDGHIFMRVAENAVSQDQRALRGSSVVYPLDSNMTALDCFNRAQAHEQLHQLKTAELYFKLVLKYFDVYYRYDHGFQRNVVTRYSILLRKAGRVSEANALEEEYGVK